MLHNNDLLKLNTLLNTCQPSYICVFPDTTEKQTINLGIFTLKETCNFPHSTFFGFTLLEMDGIINNLFLHNKLNKLNRSLNNKYFISVWVRNSKPAQNFS